MSIKVVIQNRSGEEITSFDGDGFAQAKEDARLFVKTLFRESGPYIITLFDDEGEEIEKRRLMGGRFTSTARPLERLQNIRLEKPDPTGPGIVDINPITQEELADVQNLLDTEPRAMRGIARDDFDEFIQRKRDVEKREMRKMTMIEFFNRNR